MEEVKSVDVREANFQEEVLKSEMPVLVDFWAPWCMPCRMVGQVIEKIAQSYPGRLKVCKVNVDEARQIATQLGVMSIPTLFLYKDGQVKEQFSGMSANLELELKKRIEPYL